MDKSNPNKESNCMENLMGPTKKKMISEREMEKKWRIPIVTQSTNTKTHKEGEEGHFAPNMDNTYSNIFTTNGCYVVICLPRHLYEHDTVY